jgi:hypothetical protein
MHLQEVQLTIAEARMGKNIRGCKDGDAAGIRKRMVAALRPYLTGTSTILCTMIGRQEIIAPTRSPRLSHTELALFKCFDASSGRTLFTVTFCPVRAGVHLLQSPNGAKARSTAKLESVVHRSMPASCMQPLIASAGLTLPT